MQGRKNGGRKREREDYRMKKIFVFLLAALLACAVLSGCGASKGDSAAQTGGNTSVNLAEMKQAAEEAGYEVSDEYYFAPSGVKDGFSFMLSLEDGDTHISVFEFGSAADADAYAEEINDAGYNIAVLNGKLLSMYGSDGSENEKNMVESIMNGNPIPPVNEQD